MNNLIRLQNTLIRQDSQGRYCLNDLHQASGGEQRHQPRYWLANQQTQELVQELTDSGNPLSLNNSSSKHKLTDVRIPTSLNNYPINVIKGGMEQGTYVCKELVYAYAMWINPKFHLLVIRTFDAVRTQQKPTALIPRNFAEALRLAAEQAEKIEQDAPKVAFVDHYVEVGTSKTLREVAKILDLSEKAMINALIQDGVLYRQNNTLLPKAERQKQGLFTVKTGTAENSHNFTQTRVTAKGIEWIAQRYMAQGI